MSEKINPLLTRIRNSECMAGESTLKYLERIEFLYENIKENNINIDIFSSEVNKLWDYDSACLDVWFLKFFIISEKEKEKNNWNWLFTFLYSENDIPKKEVRLLNRMEEVFNGSDSLYEGVKTKEKVQEIINWYFLNCLDETFEYMLKRLSSNFNSLYEFKETLLNILLPKISIFANTVGDKEFKNDVVKVLLKNIDYTKKLFIEKHYWNTRKEAEFNNAFNFYLQKFTLELNYKEKLPYISFTFKKPFFIWRFLEPYHLLMFILNFLTPLYLLLLLVSFIIPTTTELPVLPLVLLLFLKMLFGAEKDVFKETNHKKEKKKKFSRDNISRDTLNNEENYETKQEDNTSIVLQLLKSDKNIDKSIPLIEEIEKYKENYIKLTKFKIVYNIQSFEICLHSFDKYLLSKDKEITCEDIDRGKRIYQKVNKHFDKLIREQEKEIQELNNSELDVIEKEIDSLINN